MRKLVLIILVLWVLSMMLPACDPNPGNPETSYSENSVMETTAPRTTEQPETEESTGRDYETPIG